MKTILLFAVSMLCTSISAQTNYYTQTKTFYESGYTYQCDMDSGSGLVTLYNKNNQLTYVDPTYKSTGKLYAPSLTEVNTPAIYGWSVWHSHKRTSIVNNAFMEAEKRRLKGSELEITLYLNSDTGKVMEVNFCFTESNPFATIPVSVYRNIEMQLKRGFSVVPLAEGMKLNYMMCSWRQGVE